MSALLRALRSRKLWLAVLSLVLTSAAYPTYRVGSAIYHAQLSERTLEECELIDQPPGTKLVVLEKTEAGYGCIFADTHGRILGRAKP